MANMTTTRAEAWKAFERSLRREFGGESNRGLRAEIRRVVLAGCDAQAVGRRVALTACGAASLDEVADAARRWQEVAQAEDPEVFDSQD